MFLCEAVSVCGQAKEPPIQASILTSWNRCILPGLFLAPVGTIMGTVLVDKPSTWVNVVSKAYKYDNSENVVKELDALGYVSGSGSIMDEKISSGYGIETSYNLAGKPVTVLDPVSKERGLAFTVRLQYDGLGRKISETDAKGTVHSFTYDGLGSILSTTVNSQIVKTMGYDLAGRQTFATDGKGNTTTYEYNALNKVKKIVFPGDDTILSSFAVSQYDVMGNLAMQQDSTGKTSLYAYDHIVRQ